MTTRLTNDVATSPVSAAEFEAIAAPGVLSARLIDGHGLTFTRLDLRVPELLDMVRSELGVLVIDKADLPEVVPGKDGDLTIGGHEGYRREDSDVLPEWSARTESLRALALAEYLEAHPPVDEQQVEALVSLLNETSDGHAQGAPNIARRLIATGKVTVSS